MQLLGHGRWLPETQRWLDSKGQPGMIVLPPYGQARHKAGIWEFCEGRIEPGRSEEKRLECQPMIFLAPQRGGRGSPLTAPAGLVRRRYEAKV